MLIPRVILNKPTPTAYKNTSLNKTIMNDFKIFLDSHYEVCFALFRVRNLHWVIYIMSNRIIYRFSRPFFWIWYWKYILSQIIVIKAGSHVRCRAWSLGHQMAIFTCVIEKVCALFLNFLIMLISTSFDKKNLKIAICLTFIFIFWH